MHQTTTHLRPTLALSLGLTLSCLGASTGAEDPAAATPPSEPPKRLEHLVSGDPGHGHMVPQIGSNPRGDLVVVWASYTSDLDEHGILGRRLDRAGRPTGDVFHVNSESAGDQFQPVVGVLDDGSFVVAWQSRPGGYYSPFHVASRRFDRTAKPIGPEQPIGGAVGGVRSDPEIAMSPHGGFLVLWDGSNFTKEEGGLRAQRFAASGQPLGDEILLAGEIRDGKSAGAVGQADAVAVDDGFLVVWHGEALDGDRRGVAWRRLDATGQPVGDAQPVNTHTTGSQDNAAVAALADGTFMVAWESAEQDGDCNTVVGRVFDADGTPRSGEIRVPQITFRDQMDPDIVALDSATGRGFVVVWRSDVEGPSDTEIFGRRFDAAGTPLGGEFRVNEHLAGHQTGPTAIAVGDQVFVAWTDGEEPPVEGIVVRRLSFETPTDGGHGVVDVFPGGQSIVGEPDSYFLCRSER